jgi:hypothetical protein
MRLAFNIRGPSASYGAPAQQSLVRGYVLVERAERRQLDVVDESGQRVSLSSDSASLSFAGIAVGTKFWLVAEVQTDRPNPFAYNRSLSFSLRTEQNGPVLFASLEGQKEGGATLLDVPLAIESLCTDTTALSVPGRSRETGAACTQSVERFEAVVSADPPVHILPGTRVTAPINGASYELTLGSASYTTYSDWTCAPSDWAPSVGLDLDIVASNWRELAANQPVEIAGLPACRLGTDLPLLEVDANQLEFSRIREGTAEFAISLESSAGDALKFVSPDYGTLLATGVSAEARAVLERARWFSMSNYFGYVLRESEGGRALAVVYWGSFSELRNLVQRADVLGLSIDAEPRCDWVAEACSSDGVVRPFSVSDIVFGGEDAQRIASHERTTVTAGTTATAFDAWVAVDPSCSVDPPVRATFLVHE